MREAIKGNYPDLFIDYSQVQVAKGGLKNAHMPSATATDPETISFKWAHIPAVANIRQREQDKCILVAYSETLNLAVYTIGAATRTAETALLHTPGFTGQEMHTWLSFLGYNGRDIADSLYTGKVKIV
jgi:hypothetical protein